MRRLTDRISTAGVAWIRGLSFLTVWVLLLLRPASASAQLLSPEAEDVLADWLTILVIVLVPVIGIVAFWMVHILPEKIAHKRHHPQLDAIRTLCLLSLVFGGLLWPIAWLWAYTRPVGYKLAYGTDKVDHDAEAIEAAGPIAATEPASEKGQVS